VQHVDSETIETDFAAGSGFRVIMSDSDVGVVVKADATEEVVDMSDIMESVDETDSIEVLRLTDSLQLEKKYI
jgi:hypothetical protein